MLFSLLAFAAGFRNDTDNYYAIKDNGITNIPLITECNYETVNPFTPTFPFKQILISNICTNINVHTFLRDKY
jgi:hypothetical protein